MSQGLEIISSFMLLHPILIHFRAHLLFPIESWCLTNHHAQTLDTVSSSDKTMSFRGG